MGFMMICPWCDKEGKERPYVNSWEEAVEHLKGHGATEEQLAQARRAWDDEMKAHHDPYTVYAGCTEREAIG
ncbi:MAG: hypothetical protein PHZ19_03610 [Candidatus Thermoplasmatota archaeon]|nr:hypothetical protein [Candidatus Thermoplasmatota archaeon]